MKNKTLILLAALSLTLLSFVYCENTTSAQDTPVTAKQAFPNLLSDSPEAARNRLLLLIRVAKTHHSFQVRKQAVLAILKHPMCNTTEAQEALKAVKKDYHPTVKHAANKPCENQSK